MKTTTEVKIEEFTKNTLDTVKSGVQWFKHAEKLDKKKRWSGSDWLLLIFYSLDSLASASKTIDSGKEVFNAFSTTQPKVSPVAKEINNPLNNLTPLQILIFGSPLYFLNVETK